MTAILYINPFSYIGGGEISLLTILRNLDRARWKPYVACYAQGPLVDEVKALGIETVVFERTGVLSNIGIVFGLYRFMRKNAIRLVHINCLDIRAAAASLLAGVSYIGHLRVIFPFSWRDRWVVARSNRTISVSNAAMNVFCKTKQRYSGRFVIIPNPVDLSAPVNPVDLKGTYGFPVDSIIVGAVGRIDPFKGFEYIIKAAVRVRQQVPAARFLIVGGITADDQSGKDYLRLLNQNIEDAGLQGICVLTGFRKDILNVMAGFDILVVPSATIHTPRGLIQEGFGRVAVEGMALRVPVIVSKTGGLPEIVENGVSGIVVPAADAAALAQAIIDLMRNSAKRLGFAAAGRQRFESMYTCARHLAALEEVYGIVLKTEAFRGIVKKNAVVKKSLLAIYFFLRLPFILILKTCMPARKPVAGGVAKILIIRIDRLGDFVLSLPVIDNLRMRYPQARIDVLVKPALQEFAGLMKHISRVLVLEDMRSMVRVVRNEGYDVVIDMLCDWHLKSAVLAAASTAPVRVGFMGGWRELFFSVSVDPAKGAQDMVSLHLALVAALGVPIKVREPLIDRQCERQTDPMVIAIHPGGYYPSQRWSADRFSALAQKILVSCQAELVVIGGAADQDLVTEIVSGIGNRAVTAAYPGMKDFVSLLSRCSLLICNNSGPLHVAAALGVPTVSMMGPTDPARFWPRGKQAVVIRKETGLMESVTVDEVFVAVQRAMQDVYGIIS